MNEQQLSKRLPTCNLNVKSLCDILPYLLAPWSNFVWNLSCASCVYGRFQCNVIFSLASNILSNFAIEKHFIHFDISEKETGQECYLVFV